MKRRAADLPDVLMELAAGRDPTPTIPVDDRTVAVARDHRMTGLLWSWLRRHPDVVAPRRDLALADLQMQRHQGRIMDVLEQCVDRLHHAGFEVATLKGVTSEDRWYDRRGERPCSDVDLLLHPRDIPRLLDALRAIDPDRAVDPNVAQWYGATRAQAITLRVDGRQVDVHFDPFKLGVAARSAEWLWDSMVDFVLPSGATVRVLDDAASLVQSLVHLNKDRFQRLLQFADVARMMSSDRVDWAVFVDICRREGLDVPVLSSLQVVTTTLDLPWPVDVSRPRGPRALAWRMLWPRRVRLRGPEGRLRYRRRQDWIPILARGRFREGVAAWWRELFPPRELVDAHYGQRSAPYLVVLARGRLRTHVAKRRAVSGVRDR